MEELHDASAADQRFEAFLSGQPYPTDAGWKEVGGACLMTLAGVGYVVYRLVSRESGPNIVDALVVGVVGTSVTLLIRGAKRQSQGEEAERSEKICQFVRRYRVLFSDDSCFEGVDTACLTHFRSWLCDKEFTRFLDAYASGGTSTWDEFDWNVFFQERSFLYSQGSGRWSRDVLEKCMDTPAFKEFLHSILNFRGLVSFRDELPPALAECMAS